jgi:ORF6N domain-containing protein
MFMANEPADAGLVGIQSLILTMRGQRVMLDSDLANLFGVSTKRLLEAICQLLAPPAQEEPKRESGFHRREQAPPYPVRVHRRR